MSAFYAQHPRVVDHAIATLFPFHNPTLPPSLAQQPKGTPTKINKLKRTMGTKRINGIGKPICRCLSSSYRDLSSDPDSDLHREIYQLRAMLAATSPHGSSSVVLPTAVPVQHWTPAHDPSAFPQNPWLYSGESHTAFNASRPTRPRSHNCWLHGWNTTHNSPQCKKMMASPEYTRPLMRAAASPECWTSGNPTLLPLSAVSNTRLPL